MAVVFSRSKTWVSNEVLTAADLNSEFDNQLTHMISSGIGGASDSVADMQAVTSPGAVGTESQATDILGEVKRLRYVIKRIIGGAQWYTAPTTTLATTNRAVATTSTGTFTATALTDTTITNATVALTTYGKTVQVRFIPDGTVNPSGFYVTRIGAANANVILEVAFFRDGTEIARVAGGTLQTSSATSYCYTPPFAFGCTDAVAAGGPYTYTAKMKLGGSGSFQALYMKLEAAEV